MVTFQITITGIVQGVFFRKYTKQTALKLGITGFVKNMPNGSVYIEATGTEIQLQQFIDWCHSGSPNSKVACVTNQQLNLPIAFTSFEIRNNN